VNRSEWQRRAAGVLLEIVDSGNFLPAFTWSVSRSGYLSGWAGDEIPLRERLGAFTAWREALELPAGREPPGGPGRMHARGLWGPVPIALAATVAPAMPGAASSGMPFTYRQVRVAEVLVRLMDAEPDVAAINWHVSPAGTLAGRIRVASSAQDGRALFAAWQETLGLDEVTHTQAAPEGLARLDGTSGLRGVRVTVTTVMPAADRSGGRARPARQARQARDIIHGQGHVAQAGRAGPGRLLQPPLPGLEPYRPVQQP
jgi:hypothetical protein